MNPSRDESPLRFLSVYSGIGAFDLGLEMAGMQCVGQIEIELFCQAVLEKHWPGLPRWKDVRDAGVESIRRAVGIPDIIAGGFMCTDISCAGKGAGLAKTTRSGLTWRNLFRLIRGIRPAGIIIENVPALRGRGSDRVIAVLERIGYACWPVVVGAWAAGAPHKRDRIWIVGVLDNSAVTRRAGQSRPKSSWPIRHDSRGPESSGSCRSELGNSESDSQSGHREGSGRQQITAGGSGLGNATGIGKRKPPDQANAQPIGGEARDESGDGSCGGGNRRTGTGISPTRWPSRPGQPQHDWEEPRLSVFEMGGKFDGPSIRLVRAANKHALKALGNAVVPQVAEMIGRALIEILKSPKLGNGPTGTIYSEWR